MDNEPTNEYIRSYLDNVDKMIADNPRVHAADLAGTPNEFCHILLRRIEELEEYKWMYEELCK